jgi:energy-coupling factor transporter ATP-binding protein EcfA2
MYLRGLVLKNFRAFETLTWTLHEGEEAGWHVLLGPNGSGKSSFLRAVAIAFTGETEFTAARRPTRDFIRRAPNIDKAVISLSVSQSAEWDEWVQKGQISRGTIDAQLALQHDGAISTTGKYSRRTFWGDGRGWFSAAFGPMRRFTGGNLENVRLFASYPRLSRHLSIFGEDVALTEALEWLRQLRFSNWSAPMATVPPAFWTTSAHS